MERNSRDRWWMDWIVLGCAVVCVELTLVGTLIGLVIVGLVWAFGGVH